jgi:hypothetical protein
MYTQEDQERILKEVKGTAIFDLSVSGAALAREENMQVQKRPDYCQPRPN